MKWSRTAFDLSSDFQKAQDAIFTCQDVRPSLQCGVSIDNVVVRAVTRVAPNPVHLTTRYVLSRASGTNEIFASISIKNERSAGATNVRFTAASFGAAGAIGVLPTVGTLGAGASTDVVLRFPSSAAMPGAATSLQFSGTYDGGTFGGTFRVTAP